MAELAEAGEAEGGREGHQRRRGEDVGAKLPARRGGHLCWVAVVGVA